MDYSLDLKKLKRQEKALPKLVNVTRAEQKRLDKEEQEIKEFTLRERMLIIPHSISNTTMVRMKINIPRPNQNLSRKQNPTSPKKNT